MKDSTLEVEDTPINLFRENDIIEIVKPQQVQDADEVDSLGSDVELHELNVFHWNPKRVVDRVHDEWYESFGVYGIDGMDYGIDRSRAIEIDASGYGNYYSKEDLTSCMRVMRLAWIEVST